MAAKKLLRGGNKLVILLSKRSAKRISASHAHVLMDKPSLFDKVNFNVKLASSKLVCIMLYPIPYAKEEML